MVQEADRKGIGMRKKYRLNKGKVTEFLAGVTSLAIVVGCFMAILLKM